LRPWFEAATGGLRAGPADAIRVALDELVDATNTLAELTGLGPPEPARAGETPTHAGPSTG